MVFGMIARSPWRRIAMMLCVALFLSACTLVAPPTAQIALPQSADINRCRGRGKL